MSVRFNQWLALNEALHGGRRVRRNKRAVSLCAKVVFVSVVALAGAGIAAASPSGENFAGAGSVRAFAAGTTLTFTAADASATKVGDRLIQLAHHNGQHDGQSNNGGGFGNTGRGNQGNDRPVGNACCGGGGGSGGGGGGGGGSPPGGGGPPPGGGGGGGVIAGGGGGSADSGAGGSDPWLLVRGTPGAEDGGGTPPPGPLGLLQSQIACALGQDGLKITSDGQVLFAQFFAEQAALAFGKDGCAEVVNYPDTEETGG